MKTALFYNSTAKGGLTKQAYTPQLNAVKNVLVRVTKSMCHPADRLAVMNKYPKTSPIAGNDGLGVVIACHPSLPDHRDLVGKPVIMKRSDIGGVWAEEQVFARRDLYKLSMVNEMWRVNPATAYLLLQMAEGRNVLLSAGTSQVAHFIFQLAKQFQIGEIVALVRDKAKTPQIAGSVSFYEYADTWQRVVKGWTNGIGFDCVGGSIAADMISALPSRSKLVSYGAISGEPLYIPTRSLVFEGKRVEGFWVSEWFRTVDDARVDSLLMNLERLFADGTLTIPSGMAEVKYGDINDGSELADMRNRIIII